MRGTQRIGLAGAGILGIAALAAAVWSALREPAPPVLVARAAETAAEETRTPSPAAPVPVPTPREPAGGVEPPQAEPPPEPSAAEPPTEQAERPPREIVYVLLHGCEAIEALLESEEGRAMEPEAIARVNRLIGPAHDQKWPVMLLPGEATWIEERVRQFEETAEHPNVLDWRLELEVLQYLGPARVLDSLSDDDLLWHLYGGYFDAPLGEKDLASFAEDFAPFQALALERLEALDVENLRAKVIRAR